ncbi:MAG: phosphatase PAP2 family protein [Spirochaetes bacterium]|nr:phosphatase PAP2 family protein [Spirochaetota bacterium]
MYLEVFTIQQGSAGIVKSSANRMRPFMYNDEVSYEIKKNAAKDGDANRSFYSGHSSTAFSSVVFCAKVFDDTHPGSVYTPYIWGCGLALASTTAYLRVEAGMHYPSDVIAGAVIGSIIGYVVPWLHYNRNEMISVFPATGGLTGLGIIINF